jgi:hypothetical protein
MQSVWPEEEYKMGDPVVAGIATTATAHPGVSWSFGTQVVSLPYSVLLMWSI